MGLFIAAAVVASLVALVLFDHGEEILSELYLFQAGCFFIGGLLMTL